MKRKNHLKLISFALAACMLISMLNIPIFADGNVQKIEAVSENIMLSECESTTGDDYEQESTLYSGGNDLETNTVSSVQSSASATLDYINNEYDVETGEYVGEVESEIWSDAPIAVPGVTPSSPAVVKIASSGYIADGVYAIVNMEHTNMWMDTQYNSAKPNYYIQQYYTTTYPTQSFTRSCLFKISRIAGTDDYVIRLMTNNRLGITVVANSSGGYSVKTQLIPANDSEVSAANRFSIITGTNGYYLECKSNGLRLSSQSATASGSAGAPNSRLTAVSESAADGKAQWQLVPYIGEHREGVGSSNPSSWTDSGVAIESSVDVFYYGYSTRIGYNKINVAIGSLYTDMASVVWNESTATATYTADNIGLAITYSHITNSDGSSQVYEGYRYWRNIPVEGTYYIQNVHSNQYVDIEGPSTAEGADIQQWTFSTATQKRWIVEHVANSGGYIRFKSVYSDLYMGVNSSNTSIIEQYSAQNDYTLWKLDRTTTGNLKFICKATESSGVVLAPLSTGTTDGIDLSQIAYTDNTSYSDEWGLLPCWVVLYGVTNPGHDHISSLVTIGAQIEGNGLFGVTIRDGAILASTCKDDLLSCRIFTSRSHGKVVVYQGTDTSASTGIYLNDFSDEILSMFCSHYFPNIVNYDAEYIESTDNFSNIDVAIFIGCGTAHGGAGARNLPTKIVENGATAAIGFSDSIGCGAANEWTTVFYQYMLQGRTLEEAVSLACEATSEDSPGLNSVVICGNTSLTLC